MRPLCRYLLRAGAHLALRANGSRAADQRSLTHARPRSPPHAVSHPSLTLAPLPSPGWRGFVSYSVNLPLTAASKEAFHGTATHQPRHAVRWQGWRYQPCRLAEDRSELQRALRRHIERRHLQEPHHQRQFRLLAARHELLVRRICGGPFPAATDGNDSRGRETALLHRPVGGTGQPFVLYAMYRHVGRRRRQQLLLGAAHRGRRLISGQARHTVVLCQGGCRKEDFARSDADVRYRRLRSTASA